MNQLSLKGDGLTIEEVVEVAMNPSIQVTVAEEAKSRIAESRKFVEDAVSSKKVIYGLTTGFGYFKNTKIDEADSARLQENLVMSHAVGVGKPLSREEVRAMILVRINSLVKGYSGVRPLVIETLIAFLNKDVYPYVPEKGSLGASGDLAPLAHLCLTLIGKGEAFVNNQRVSASEALRAAGTEPVILSSKEGLALTNGTAMMSGLSCLNLYRAEQLAKVADLSGAMSVEAMMGSLVPFHPSVHIVRAHTGQQQCAKNIRRLCAESQIIQSHSNCGRVQDSYSLRCIPQVHGAVRDTLAHVRRILEIEINSATDNPLIFAEEGTSRSAGNFHGEPLAFCMDFLAIAMAEIASISERRIAKAVDSANSEGLPAFLIPEDQAGVSSGFMILQYTAASLVSENKTLAHPDSVDSIPTSANQEDHVSMGAAAARHARDVIQNTLCVLAIELMTAAQALDFRKPLTPGNGARAGYEFIRERVTFVERDRILYSDLEAMISMLEEGSLLQRIEQRVGILE